MVKATCRFSGMVTGYHPWTQSALAAFYHKRCDQNQSFNHGIACTIPLATYWTEAIGEEITFSESDQLYSLPKALVPAPVERIRFLSHDDGFGYIERRDRLIASKVFSRMAHQCTNVFHHLFLNTENCLNNSNSVSSCREGFGSRSQQMNAPL